MNRIGKIKPKNASEITESPFCIGCETLDRELWNPSEVYPFLQKLPIKTARLQTGWSRCEKERGVYDFKWLDNCVDGLLKAGIRPFLNVGYGNALYEQMNADGVGYQPLYSDKYFAAWKDYVSALCKHFLGRISIFEIWNEPNMAGIFWQPAKEREPEAYGRLFEETAKIIRSEVPDAKIVGGVISCMDYEFTRRFLESCNLNNLDIFSFHPYRSYPERHYHKQLDALRSLIKKYAPHAKLWQAEFGYPSMSSSTGYPGSVGHSEIIQAKVLLRKLLDDCGLGLELSEWFLAVDLHNYPKGTENVNSKGLLKTIPEVAPKIAFNALQYLGSIINGKIMPSINITYAINSEQEVDKTFITELLMADHAELSNISTVKLIVNDVPVLAYWNNGTLRDDLQFEKINLIYQNCEGLMFSNPILCDLLNGEIYDLSNGKHEHIVHDAWEVNLFRDIPLTDYPFIIVDKCLIDENWLS